MLEVGLPHPVGDALRVDVVAAGQRRAAGNDVLLHQRQNGEGIHVPRDVAAAAADVAFRCTAVTALAARRVPPMPRAASLCGGGGGSSRLEEVSCLGLGRRRSIAVVGGLELGIGLTSPPQVQHRRLQVDEERLPLRQPLVQVLNGVIA